MRHVTCTTIVGFAAVPAALGQVSGTSGPHVDHSATPVSLCDTTFIGVMGDDWQDPANGTNGVPTPARVACQVEEAGSGQSSVVSDPLSALGSELSAIRDPPSGRTTTPQLYNPPAPTSLGACCMGSTCQIMDYFDCRERDGYFKEGVLGCFSHTCTPGACCLADDASCVDDDGVGGDMDEGLCISLSGHYLGGASCETDPCERFRIPHGFEIAELTPGLEMIRKRWPHLNNCGQIVFRLGFEEDSEIFLYDNGGLVQATDDPTTGNVVPEINDYGDIVWNHGWDFYGRGDIMMLHDGTMTVLGEGTAAVINNAGHAAYYLWRSQCPGPSRRALYFYNGVNAEVLFDDGLSNQSVAINDLDEIAWMHATFPCGGGFGDWTSQIMLYAGGAFSVLPSSVDTPQGPDINNQTQVAWDMTPSSIEIWENGNTTILSNEKEATVALNNSGDIAFSRWMPGWQLWVRLDGQFYAISRPDDFETAPYFDNARSDINDAGEIAWWWLLNGDVLPSGIRYMRRIRDGDVNFDGVVDMGDFIPMPGCYTGPVPTDGLCECRFYDIDHDRDVDHDDFELFLRVYTGPLDDCNGNATLDLEELLDGSASDCNRNGIIDSCDITNGTATDVDGDGVLDECCVTDAPLQPVSFVTTNRYLSLVVADPTGGSGLVVVDDDRFLMQGAPRGAVQAMRVTCVDLPAPFDALNGTTMWVGPPVRTSENGGSRDPIEGFADFQAATLQCSPFFADWSVGGPVYVYHELIVPGGRYDVQAIEQGCGQSGSINYSAPLSVTTARWGDLVGLFDTQVGRWTGPDDSVDVATDVLAILDKFASLSGSPIKARADLEPARPDRIINITDVTRALSAFGGETYPFSPPLPCP